jgi:thiol:disulfide interchange protein DsbD
MKKYLTGLLLALAHLSCTAYDLAFREKHTDPTHTSLFVYVTLNPNEIIYEKEILLSINNPHVELSAWKTEIKASTTYDPQFKEQRTVFDKNFTIEAEASKIIEAPQKSSTLHVILASNEHPSPQEKLFTVSFLTPNAQGASNDSTSLQNFSSDTKEVTPKTEKSWQEWSQSLKEKIIATESWSLRLLFALLLGILLSLTPCIYPMIPITVGILQTQGTSSLLRNFLLSLCYALGLGTTFSLMGLLAASSGQAFGHLLGNPIFVLCIVALLCYFAFSLFGFYNLYIPRFMQNKGSYSKSGSALSIFLFGMASGTFASPCLSPGLALILALVAAMANKLAGLLLLFSFGLGLSVPLIIIGTFSSSITMLPRAGMWMMEVQKIFGFMLLSMCLYYLSAIAPSYLILSLLTVFFLVVGLYYIQKKTPSYFWRLIKNCIGFLCIILSAFVAIQALHEIFYSEKEIIVTLPWYTNYEEAAAAAQAKNKKLFIDFSTPYCSICSAITKKVLQDKEISKVLTDRYILLAIDASDSKEEPYKTLRDRYDIQGVPTILIIEPTSGKELKRWMSELYSAKRNQVIADLKTYSL